jgi:hypothetical protein
MIEMTEQQQWIALAILFGLSVMVSIVVTISITANASSDDDEACDASYPDVCIAPAPPDLNCDDIAGKNFQVLPPDPHGFDRDGDGTGCET